MEASKKTIAERLLEGERTALARLISWAEDGDDRFARSLAQVYPRVGKAFRIGHLGSLTDVMALSGIATAEMVMADLGLNIQLGSGVAAAQDYYRGNTASSAKAAA